MVTQCPVCGSEFVHHNRRLGKWECEDCHATFEKKDASVRELTLADLHVVSDRPLKLFLSYPHSSRWICARIRDALRERGHDVWFDEEAIEPGMDWRRAITEGIEDRKHVVSCLSQDAVREEGEYRGVCLDELSIAVSTPGCILNTVLLEPADLVRPSASIAHRQWIDMSAWQQMRARGEDEFNSWFDNRMLEALSMVESDENLEVAGEISQLHKLLPQAEWRMGREELLGEPFVGREWLANKVRDWLLDPDGGTLCALWGDPGVGKSAFCAWMSFRNLLVAASLFFEHGNSRFNSASVMVQTIAYQLAHRLPDYRKRLLEVLCQTPVGTLGASELLELLVLRPLTMRKVDGGMDAMCIVVDGLDECTEGERNSAVPLLHELQRRLPRWLRVLAVSRPDAAVTSAIRPDKEMSINDERAKNLQDVEAYLREELALLVGEEGARNGIATSLAHRSDGVFLFAKAAVESARLGAFDLLDKRTYPATLGQVFYGWLNRLFPDEGDYRHRFRIPIGGIVAAPDPLPNVELERLLGMCESDSRDLRRRMQALLTCGEDDMGNPTVSMFHRYLVDWLQTEEAGPFAVSTRDAVSYMADLFHRVAIENPESITLFEAVNGFGLLEQSDHANGMMECLRSRDLALRYNSLGNELRTWGKLPKSEKLYIQAHGIFEFRNKELGTPESMRDLCASLQRIGDAMVKREALGDAEAYYLRLLDVAVKLADMVQTEDSKMVLGVALHRMVTVSQMLGKEDEATQYMAMSLILRQQ